MHVTIHDVGHGFCALVECPNGVRYLLDCGRGKTRGWSPSAAYAGTSIDMLIIQNLDEDHVEDLSELLETSAIHGIFSNPTIYANALFEMKPYGMRTGVSTMHNLLRKYGPGLIGLMPNPGTVDARTFWSNYGQHFTDTNNLSLATYFRYGAFTILFGGDLEREGWTNLLSLPSFRNRLPQVRVFVTSHHGRDNGKCEDLFEFMRPDIAIISDDGIQYGTQQNSTQWYQTRVSGIPVIGTEGFLGGPEMRYVFTTRRDGAISIAIGDSGNYRVSPEHGYRPPSAH